MGYFHLNYPIKPSFGNPHNSLLLVQMLPKQVVPFFFLFLLLVSFHANEAAIVQDLPPEKDDMTPIPAIGDSHNYIPDAGKQELGTPAKPRPPSCSPKC